MTLYHYEYDSSTDNMSITPEEFEDIDIEKSEFINKLNSIFGIPSKNIGTIFFDILSTNESNRHSSCEVTAEMWSTLPDDMYSFKNDIKIHIRKYVNNLLDIFEDLSVKEYKP